MNLAGLMPIRCGPLTDKYGSLLQLLDCCDVVIVLDDNSDPAAFGELQRKYGEATPHFPKTVKAWIQYRSDPSISWNDWINRGQLLLEATRYDCQWCLWLDDDETLFTGSLTEGPRPCIDRAIESVKNMPAVTRIAFPWLQCWGDDKHVRTDAWWRDRRKPFLQKNPFFSNIAVWNGSPRIRVHQFPFTSGAVVHRNDFAVLHYGMMTAELRKARWEKYRAIDPEGVFDDEFQKRKVGFEDETPGQLTKLEDIKLSEFPCP